MGNRTPYTFQEGALNKAVSFVGKKINKKISDKKRALSKTISEETSKASKADSAAEFDRRVAVRKEAGLSVEKERQNTAKTKAKAQTDVLAARQAEREHREQAPVRRQAAKTAATASKPAKPVKPTNVTKAAPKAAPTSRPRKQSPAVREAFTSPVGDAPVAAPKKKAPVAGYDLVWKIGDETPAQASED